jgi:hypothetical protein
LNFTQTRSVTERLLILMVRAIHLRQTFGLESMVVVVGTALGGFVVLGLLGSATGVGNGSGRGGSPAIGSFVVVVVEASKMIGGGTVAAVEEGVLAAVVGTDGAPALVGVVVVIGGDDVVAPAAAPDKAVEGDPMLKAMVAKEETSTSVHEVSVPICPGDERRATPSPNSPPAVFAPQVQRVPSPLIAAEW